MSILVLGGAGYIGSHTVRELIDAGRDVVVVDNLQTGFRKAIHPLARFYEVDIRNRSALEHVFASEDIERGINGKSPAERLAVRQELSAPLMAELHTWLTEQVAKLSRGHDLTKACFYMLKRWDAFTRFLDDGRICLTNNAAERALRCIPLGRKAWLFCGSDRGGQRAAIIYTLIQTARLNDVDPQAWLADVLASIADHPATRLDELLPWNWRKSEGLLSQAA